MIYYTTLYYIILCNTVLYCILTGKTNNFINNFIDNFVDNSNVNFNFPLTDNDLSASTTIKVMVHNTGTTIISNPDMFYFVNGVQMVHETPTLTLNPGDSLEYSFVTPASFIQGNEYHIAAMIATTGDQASSDDVASIIINNSVGINETTNDESYFSIYPNPANDKFTLVSKKMQNDCEIQITDIIGKTVFKSNVSKEEIHNGYVISGNFEQGTYIVQLFSSGKTSYQKLVIEKR